MVFEKVKSIHAGKNHLQAPSEDCISGTQGGTLKDLEMLIRGECSMGIIMLFQLL